MREHWRSSSRWMPSHPTPSCLLIALIRSRPIPEEASEKKGFRSFDVQKGAAVQYLPHTSHSQYLSLFFFCCCCCSGINCLKMFFPRLALFPKWSDKKIDGCLFPRRFIFSQWMQPVGLSISRVFFWSSVGILAATGSRIDAADEFLRVFLLSCRCEKCKRRLTTNKQQPVVAAQEQDLCWFLLK